MALSGSRVFVAARGDTAAAGADVRRVYHFPYEAESGEPPGTEVRRPDGGVLNDLTGALAADDNLLLVVSQGAGAWIIDFEPLFADGFEAAQ